MIIAIFREWNYQNTNLTAFVYSNKAVFFYLTPDNTVAKLQCPQLGDKNRFKSVFLQANNEGFRLRVKSAACGKPKN